MARASAVLRALRSARVRLSQTAHWALQRYYDDMLGLRAASLTYTTLLTLVPFLAVTFSVLKAFGIQYLLEPLLTEAFAPLGPDRIEITRRIIAFVDNTRVDVLGVVGVAGLFYSVILLVGNVEESLNQIWRVQPSRTWTRRYGEYMGLLLVGPVLVVAGFALIASAQSYWLVQRLVDMQVFGIQVSLFTRLLPFVFLCAGFVFLYKFIPSTHVPLTSALIGAAVAAVMWQLSSIAFTAFVAGSVSYAAIYSGFAILVVFLVWLYVAWLIVLIGAETAYLHQHASVYLPGVARRQGHIFEERLALALLREVTSRFIDGKPPTTEKNLSRALGAVPDQVDALIEKFISRGLLLRSSQPPGVSLARPPEKILATEVLDILHGVIDVAAGNGDVVTDFLRRREKLVNESFAGVTLKSLASGDDPPR